MLPKNILVPVDFSPFSEDALDYAVELATKLDAKVHVLHAIGIVALGFPELGSAMTAPVIDQMMKDSDAAIAKLVAAHKRTGVIGEVMQRTGDARDLIMCACEDTHADLVVMGTHGRRGVRRAVLGSVAESVVRTAPCPVLTIRAAKGRE